MAGKTTGTTKAKPRAKSSARQETPIFSAKPKRPVVSTGTWITILLLAILIGFTFYTKREKETNSEATPTVAVITYIFAATEGTASSIEIKPTDGETFLIARDDKNAWVLKLPLEAEADQGLAEAAAAQVSALQVVDPVDGNPSNFGFDNPAYIFTIEFAGGKKHTLEIGDSTPTNSGYYVRVDKDKMMITSLSGIDSLLQLIFFPPYLNTPTPTALPLPTETPVPPTESISTPEVTVTPTP